MSSIRVINPNTTASMTAAIERSARGVLAPGTRLEAVTSSTGPASIESHYDEALSVPGVLAAVADGEGMGCDGYVIACFGDPGLDAARELASGPVLGIAEAAMHAASLLGRSFSVVTSLGRTRGRARDLAVGYGFGEHCRGVHACEIPVLDLDSDPAARRTVTDACRAALELDGSDVIVLGCAGMADFAAETSAAIGAPVVDGVASATALLQALLAMNLRTSQVGEFAPPLPKAYTGMMESFARPPALALR